LYVYQYAYIFVNYIQSRIADQNLVDVSVKDLEVVNTVVANNDEILDVVHLGVNASHLAVACNSSALRLYEVWGFFQIYLLFRIQLYFLLFNT
jgi:hypothetical protein